MPPSILKDQNRLNTGVDSIRTRQETIDAAVIPAPAIYNTQSTIANSTANFSSTKKVKISRPSYRQHKRSVSSPVVVAKLDPQAALDTLQSKLALRRYRYGSSHPSVGNLWNKIGNEHFRTCQFDTALDAYKHAVQCDPGDHLAVAYSNIGTVYWTTGQIKKSITFLRKALNIYELDELSEGRDPDTNMVMADVSYQLGLALTLDGDYGQAHKVLKKTQRKQEIILGKSSLSVGRTMDAIGKVLYFQGDLIEALKYHDMALRIKEYVSDDSMTVIASLLNIAAVYSKGQHLREALASYERALQLQRVEFAKSKDGNKSRQFQVRAATDVGETLQFMHALSIKLRNEIDAQRYSMAAIVMYQEAGLTSEDPRLATLLNNSRHGCLLHYKEGFIGMNRLANKI